MGKDSNNSGIPVFGEVIKLLNRQEINTIAEELTTGKYTRRLDSYQHKDNGSHSIIPGRMILRIYTLTCLSRM